MWYILAVLAGLLISGPPVFAGQFNPDPRLGELKRDTRVFERIVSEVLRQNFSNPFAIAAGPHAAYLPGYGVVVSFHLKISRGTIRAFQKEVPAGAEPVSRSREEQLEMVREIVRLALGDYGSTLKNLSSSELVSICAIVEDRNELDPSKNRTDMVVSATKGNIDLFSTRRISSEEFRKRLSRIEY